MALPLANYLRTQSRVWPIKLILGCGILLTLVSIIGSYSRGALIALGVLAIAVFLRTRRKFLYLGLALGFGALVLNFMPQEFWDRANTIQSSDTDASFQDRVMSWHVAYDYARDHFPFGAGFYGPQLKGVYNAYFPGASPHAAHSIYFQVLGENGFVGLAIYLALLLGTFLKSASIMRQTRGRPELRWCYELARMIQLSLLCFCVGGAALSMAYYDVFIVCAALLVPMRTASAEFRRRNLPESRTNAAVALGATS
jgi:probable O-glycosylation ligase (exosortase A-associated)